MFYLVLFPLQPQSYTFFSRKQTILQIQSKAYAMIIIAYGLSFLIIKQHFPVQSNQYLQYFEYLKMKRTAFLSMFILIALGAIQFRINTNQDPQIRAGDSLISTLGFFRATLVQNGCILSIQSFSASKVYIKAGNYTSENVTSNCRSLMIRPGKITTDTNLTYLSLGKQDYDLSTIFTIDDYGVMRLIGTSFGLNGASQISQEKIITDFRQNSTFFYPESNLLFSFTNSLPLLTNLRKWFFRAQAGQLSISQADDEGIFINYFYNYLRIQNSQLSDFNSKTFPGVIFQNITFTPRCLESRVFLSYKPPFVFVADPYWPIFTVYEQGRYKVFEIGYSQVFQTQSWQSTHRLSVRKQVHVCPKYTFQYQGDCVTFCPSPFYHELRSQYGYCVLTCQQFTPKNDTTRMCSCFNEYENPLISSKIITGCPANTTEYFYGCSCTENNRFFDRSVSLSCVQNCPEGTIGVNSLCMECPTECLTCKKDRLFRALLQCTKCRPQFQVVRGQCFRICNPGFILSPPINGTCQQCTDQFCLNCSENINICVACKLLYTIQGNSCVKKCDDSSLLVPHYGLKSQCIINDTKCRQSQANFYKNTPYIKCRRCSNSQFMHMNTCVRSCPQGYTANSNNFCYCSNSSTVTINDKCLTMVGCPIDMGWDTQSSSCNSCPFGCVNCYSNVCTACNPGFILFISPRSISCRKQSPLFTCDNENSVVQSTCLVIQYTDPSFGLIKCLNNIKNCKVCNVQDSDDICALCLPNFYLFNNTCVARCTNGTSPYINVCLVTQIRNCSIPFLKLFYEQFQFSYDDISTSPAYSYYTFDGFQPINDPIGYIPVYQELISKTNDGVPRSSQFYRSTWTCLKCEDSMGLSSDFLTCIPCPAPCLTCYKALSTSCLTKNTGCPYYIHSVTRQCIQSCSSESFIPNIINGVLYCSPLSSSAVQQYTRIDSAIYTSSEGKNHVFFIVDQKLKSSSNLFLPILKKSSLPSLSASNDSATSSIQMAQLNQNGFLNLYDQDASNVIYVLNMTSSISSIVGNDNSLFPNTMYGALKDQSHVQFMKTWLAFIGYIMSITLILLHAVFIGNNLLYKVDNVLILAQSIYYFSFVQLLVGKLLSQFYYGWIFAHFGFFPNFFRHLIPSNYVELAAPNSYKLATLDANIARNAGFAFSLLLVFIASYLVVTIVCWILAKICRKEQVWHPEIAKNSLYAGWQFISMSIFYWACANLMYIKGADSTDADYYHTSQTVSIFFLVLISVYTLIRWFINPLGGLYMAKRILLAAILAASYLDKNMIAPLIILEAVFTLMRYFMQNPETKRQKIYLLAEFLLFVVVYLLCSLSLNAGVNTIIISVIIFVLTVALAYDLTEIYLQSKNEWLVQDENVNEVQKMAKAEAQKSAIMSYKQSPSVMKQGE